MQNVLKRKKKYFNETFFEIYSVGPVCFIKFYCKSTEENNFLGIVGHFRFFFFFFFNQNRVF